MFNAESMVLLSLLLLLLLLKPAGFTSWHHDTCPNLCKLCFDQMLI